MIKNNKHNKKKKILRKIIIVKIILIMGSYSIAYQSKYLLGQNPNQAFLPTWQRDTWIERNKNKNKYKNKNILKN
jgi:hypothetical protein